MAKKLRVGIAGLGTVGIGVVKLFADPNGRLNEKMELVAVAARDRGRARGADVARYRWHDGAEAMAADADIDVLVELIGGADGPAKRAVETALARGAHVITANKALIATHGAALAQLAEETGAKLLFEAAVGGGVPMVKALRDGVAGCRACSVAGILNGTCNFILTEMENGGRPFADVLAGRSGLVTPKPIPPWILAAGMRRISSPSSPRSRLARGPISSMCASKASRTLRSPTSAWPASWAIGSN